MLRPGCISCKPWSSSLIKFLTLFLHFQKEIMYLVTCPNCFFFKSDYRKMIFFSCIFAFAWLPLNLHVSEVAKDSQQKRMELQEHANLMATMQNNVKTLYSQKNWFPLNKLKNGLDSLLIHYFLLKNAQKWNLKIWSNWHFKDPVLAMMLHAPLNNWSLAPVQTKTITEACEASWPILGL